ncbi:MAG: FTR1 family iron permease [Cyanobacteria bacterium J055]|nr:MAG: FTR1 family iron permease [Cyanobacteria bacterium J055]
MDFSTALPTFIVTFREGFEAALVVGIVLACLKKAQQTHLKSWVLGGVGAGIFASTMVGITLGWGLKILRTSNKPYAPVIEPLFKTGLCVLAIVMLSWMLIWMTQQARTLKAEVEAAISTALVENSRQAGWGIFGLVFVAVLREGFETVVFVLAKFQQGWIPVLGAIGGLIGATLLGVLLFRWGVKINLRLFFQVMGIFLLLIVSGLAVSALKYAESAALTLSQLQPQFANLCSGDRASCLLGPLVWDLSHLLPDKKFPGLLLKALFGYRDRIFALQAIAYLALLVTAGSLYFQNLSTPSDSRAIGSASSH